MFERLNLSDTTKAHIEWDMTPDLAFCTFTAKGLRDELVSTSERVCYFFIDNWGDAPKLYLMERGVRHVNILAEIKAPGTLLTDCIIRQGGSLTSKENYPVDAVLKKWLLDEVVSQADSPYLIPTVEEDAVEEDMGEPLPAMGRFSGERIVLPAEKGTFSDADIDPMMQHWNFFDAKRNPQGEFANELVDTEDGLTVVDERTGIMWQRAGLELSSIRSMKKSIEELNSKGFAGHGDWRMPSLEEALSLVEKEENAKGMHLHPCFSKEQTFIFVAARRKPTGYWFVDYRQGLVYWSSGTVPGGFARLCRSAA